MLANQVSRYNQPTVDLLTDPEILDQVKNALLMGASKRSIANQVSLNWRQVNAIVEYLERCQPMK